MEQSDTFIVAKEGWKFVGLSLALFIFAILLDLDLLQFIALVSALLFAYIYRNPERIVPYYQENSIVSVADGRVSSIETVESGPFLEGPCYKVEIVSSYFDTALLRMPFDAVVKHSELRRGSRLGKAVPLSAQLNERALLSFEDASGQRCSAEHILDQSIDAISLHLHGERKMPQGGRYGLAVKGVHTLYLPTESRVAVNVGDDVQAGVSLIGYFS